MNRTTALRQSLGPWLGTAALTLAIGCSTDSGADDNGSAMGGSAGVAGSTSGAAGGGSGGAATGGSGGMNDGVCRPNLVAPAENPNAVVLVQVPAMEPFGGLGAPRVVGDMVLYRDLEGLARIPKAGGAPERLFADTALGSFTVANGLAYFIRDSALYSVSASAPSATATTVLPTLTFSTVNDLVITIDATRVFLWIRARNEIQAVELASGMVTVILTGVENQGWVVQNEFVYFVGSNDTIQRVPVTGGTPEILHIGGNIVWSVGVDGADLYYGGSDAIYKVGMPAQPLLYWDAGFIERVDPVGPRLVYQGSDGTTGWVMKDATSCRALVRDSFGFAGSDYDDAGIFLAHDSTLYRIPW